MNKIAMFGLLSVALAAAGACSKDKEKNENEADESEASKSSAKESGADPKGEPTEPKDAAGAETIATIETCWSAFTAWDKAKFRTCFADETELTTIDAVPPMPPASSPKDVIVQTGAFRNAFPDFQGELALVLANGRKAVAVGQFSGTHKGLTLGMPPTNKSISLNYAQAFELDDQGRIVKERDYMDQATLLSQLGILESMSAPSKEEPLGKKVRASTEGSATEKANLAAYEKAFEALSKGDMKTVMESYASDAVYRYMPAAEPFVGPEDIGAARDFRAQNKDVELSIRDVWAAGDWVVAETTTQGVVAEEFSGIEGTKDQPWELQSLELVEFGDGKIKRHMVFANGLKFAADVGLFDPAMMGGG